MSEMSPSDQAREDRLLSIIAEYERAVDEDRTVPQLAELLVQHPDLAGDLAQFYADRERGLAHILKVAPIALPDQRTSERATQSTLTPCAEGALPEFSGYAVSEEIGKGGIGLVYRAMDPDLNRDLAIKVLRPKFAQSLAMARRFVEEAQITGQLQHPGIVPVHGLSRLPDGRPYFTMKLIRGSTLAALLKPPTSTKEKLPRFLKVFEQICQTVAYAHSKGVIHRDLKPLNVMVGAFGEVQVMDWGLAKVLGRADGTVEMVAADGSVRTVRSDDSQAESQPGDVLGTLAYMAPEQARGEVDVLDERADVFGLGAILCEILTGEPPYSRCRNVFDAARQGDVAEAFARLDVCGADAELIALAKCCLAPVRDDRLRNGGAVEAALTGYLNGVQERLRRAELERAAAEAKQKEAEAKARAERKARRRTVWLAIAVVLFVSSVGGGAWWIDKIRAERREQETRQAIEKARREAETDRDASAGLREASAFVQEGWAVKDDPVQWDARLGKAFAALKQSEGVIANGLAGSDLRQRAANGRAEVEAADRDRRMVDRLDVIQLLASDFTERFDPARSAKAYADAFADYGLNVFALEPDVTASIIRKFPIKERLTAALMDWWKYEGDKRRLDQIRKTAFEVEPNLLELYSRLLTAANASGSVDFSAEFSQAIANSRHLLDSPRTAVEVATFIAAYGEFKEAAHLLQQAVRLYPNDFWVNHNLAFFCQEQIPPKIDDAIRFYTAALALRPQTNTVHMNLGIMLLEKREIDRAKEYLTEAIRRSPDSGGAYHHLANAHVLAGEREEAIRCLRKACAAEPDFLASRYFLATLLSQEGEHEDALKLLDNVIALYALKVRERPKRSAPYAKDSPRVNPPLVKAIAWRGWVLLKLGRTDEAEQAYVRALGADPNYFDAHINLGVIYAKSGKLKQAITSLSKAAVLKPEVPEAHRELGKAYRQAGMVEKAIASLKEAVRLEPANPETRVEYGDALMTKEAWAEAIAAYREAIRLGCNDPAVPGRLRAALTKLGRVDPVAAVSGEVSDQPKVQSPDAPLQAARDAVRRNPGDADSQRTLGKLLEKAGMRREAITHFREAIRLQPDSVKAHLDLGLAQFNEREYAEAFRTLTQAASLDPLDPWPPYLLARVYDARGEWHRSVEAYREAVRLEHPYPAATCELGMALIRAGELQKGLAGLRDAARRMPDFPYAHYCLAYGLEATDQLEEALAATQTALKLKPFYPEASLNLANTLCALGRFDDAVREMERCHKAVSSTRGARYPTAEWLSRIKQVAAYNDHLNEVLSGSRVVEEPAELLKLAQFCHRYRRLYREAVRFYEQAVSARPSLADELEGGDRHGAALSAALASAGRGEDAAKIDEKERTELRGKAIEWLRADLAMLERHAKANARFRTPMVEMLRSMSTRRELAVLREKEFVEKLSENDRAACKQLWDEVAAMLKKYSQPE